MKHHPLHKAPIRTGRPWETLVSLVVLEIFIGTILATVAFVFFFDLSRQVMTDDFLMFDRVVTVSIFSLRSPLLTHVMLFFTFLGGAFMLAISSVVLISLLLWQRYRYEAALFALTVATGFWLNLLFKAIVARARPDTAPIIQELFYSFPSGHSMNSLVFYGLLAFFTYHFTRNKLLTVLVSALCALIILSIGVSRVYLGVHYPSDVLAGFLAGMGWFLTVLVIDRTLTAYRFYRGKTTR